MNPHSLAYSKEVATAYARITTEELPADVFIQDFLKQHGKNAHILDFGCGDGRLFSLFTKYGATRITGIDPSSAMIAGAHELNRTSDSVTAEVQTAATLPYGDATFDCIVSNFALHYVKDTVDTLKELYRVLKPGGMLVAVFGDAQFTDRHDALRDTPLPLIFKNEMQVMTLAKDAERVREETQSAGFTIEDFHRLPQEVSIATVPATYVERENVTIGIARIVARKA